MNKEQVHDEKIAPLMAQIIETCKKHGIAMIADFAIPTEEDGGLRCITCLPDENGEHAYGHLEARRILLHERTPLMLRVDHGDGSVTMEAIMPSYEDETP